MTEDVNGDRRRFIGIATLSIAAAELGIIPSAAKSKEINPAIINELINESSGPLKQMDAGLLNKGGVGHNLPQEAPQAFCPGYFGR